MSLATRTKTRVSAVRSYPTDLAVVSIAAVLSYLLVTSMPAGESLRLFAALPLIVFLPGYALVSVLFPARARSARESMADTAEGYPRGIDSIERVALGFTLSLVIAPLVTMGLAPSQWGLTPAATAGALALGTVVLSQLGFVRRVRVPEPDRFEASLTSLLGRVRSPEDGGAVATASSILLTIGVAATAIALAVSLVSPPAAGGFTELGVYTEDDNGDLVADDYPEELSPSESETLLLSIENGEGNETTYTVVVQQQQLEGDEVTERTELDRFEQTVGDGENVTVEHDLSPEPADDDDEVRVVYMLFEGDAPDDPTRADADEDVFVWLTVTDEESGE